MENVGILSMQRVINYGSFLQAYALKKMLENQGAANVYFIDICQGKTLPGFDPKPKESRFIKFKEAVISGNLISKIKGKSFYDDQSKRFQDKFFPMLGLDDKCPEHLDMAVIGSDEVFNCCQRAKWGYTTQLYGNIPQAKKVISYAASFGHTTYEKLQDLGIAEEIGKWLKTQASISVRDDNSLDIVKNLTQKEPQKHLDPVLIYDFSQEIKQCSEPNIKNYIIIYAYRDRIHSIEEINEIRNFARKTGKRLVSLGSYYSWCDKSIVPTSPFEVLKWFRSADYIITDTFHGTIFSVISRRKFCTLLRNTNTQKLSSLLNTLSLTEQGIMTKPQQIGKILQQDINYDLVESLIAQEREKSNKYLNIAMKKEC